MTSVRDHVAAVAAAGDLLSIGERVHWAGEAAAVGVETVGANGPAVLFEDTPGAARLAAGLYTGPDLMRRRDRLPWSRSALGLGLPFDTPYRTILDRIAAPNAPREGDITRDDLRAVERDPDLYALGLPSIGDDDSPTLTLGLLSGTIDGTTVWAPVRGAVFGGDRVRASVPRPFADRLFAAADRTEDADADGSEDRVAVTLALGAPEAALMTAILGWAGETEFADYAARANAMDAIPMAETRGGLIPATAEVVIDGAATRAAATPAGPREAWELTTETAAVEIGISRLSTREEPLVPFAPVSAPMSDDIALVSVVESAHLCRRVNGYWGVSPVEWISLPPEVGLGICIVATDVLYAGFEWQLANTLFSFSRLFDKVLLLDDDASPTNLGRAFDDMWVKAHPSQDWEFSESDAPAATVPLYRRDGTTGSRVYIAATWDPRWEEGYIAPRVDFETSYPAEVQETVVDRWDEFGFRNSPRTRDRADDPTDDEARDDGDSPNRRGR